MIRPQDLPHQLTELYEMSKEYLRQETVEPLKKLGSHAGLGIGGAVMMSFGAVMLTWALYFGLDRVLPEGRWWSVLAKFSTAVAAAVAAGIVGWRMGASSEEATT